MVTDPACEVNEKGTREKNDGNEALEEGTSPPLDLDLKETFEADEETLPYADKDWDNPEQIEVPKNLESDLPFSTPTQQIDRARPTKKYNPHGDDFVLDKIDLKKIIENLVGLEEINVSQVDIVDDQDKEWIVDRSKPEMEFDDEQQQSYEQELTTHARFGVVERDDVRPKGNQCHDSRHGPREHGKNKESQT